MNTTPSSTPNSKAANEVAHAVESLRTAMLTADGVLLTSLAHDELSYGHSGAQMQNKQEFVQTFTSGDSVFTSIEITGQTIRIVGDTAIVRHVLTAATNDKGKGPGTVKISILLVWVRSNGHSWQLLARQAVKVV
ncbi:MAG TPA: nuclear transport factor 2 family protein [Mucilaginibacter sp.]|nr:nuclear transport factor 2 family protein [Mucilaginibacter sp.]